jgi:hypothetical protein
MRIPCAGKELIGLVCESPRSLASLLESIVLTEDERNSGSNGGSKSKFNAQGDKRQSFDGRTVLMRLARLALQGRPAPMVNQRELNGTLDTPGDEELQESKKAECVLSTYAAGLGSRNCFLLLNSLTWGELVRIAVASAPHSSCRHVPSTSSE